MSDRHCVKCGRTIVSGVSGNLCLKCKFDEYSESEDGSSYFSESLYDVKDMAQKMGVSARTARRKVHNGIIPGNVPGIMQHLFIQKIVDN